MAFGCRRFPDHLHIDRSLGQQFGKEFHRNVQCALVLVGFLHVEYLAGGSFQHITRFDDLRGNVMAVLLLAHLRLHQVIYEAATIGADVRLCPGQPVAAPVACRDCDHDQT